MSVEYLQIINSQLKKLDSLRSNVSNLNEIVNDVSKNAVILSNKQLPPPNVIEYDNEVTKFTLMQRRKLQISRGHLSNVRNQFEMKLPHEDFIGDDETAVMPSNDNFKCAIAWKCNKKHRKNKIYIDKIKHILMD